MHEHHLEDDEYVERFQREARTVAQLSHPNIVTVIDRGEDDGRPFIVFEYVDGDTLDELVERDGALPVDEALGSRSAPRAGSRSRTARGSCTATSSRRTSCSTASGQPKVTDFGIARSLDVKKGVTQTGTVLGTSNYIAPEQASGEKATRAERRLLARRRPLRAAHRPQAVQRRQLRRGRDEAHQRARRRAWRTCGATCRLASRPPSRARSRRTRATASPSMEAFAAELEACLHELRTAGDADSTATVITPPAPRARRRARRAGASRRRRSSSRCSRSPRWR